MTRWRRPGANEIILVYLLLEAIAFICSQLSGSAGLRYSLSGLPVIAFLAWRVSRGGRISRMLLIISSGLSYLGATLAVARLWNLPVMALVVISAAQVALLVSPPVYGRTRPVPVLARAQGWLQFVRRPPAWLLPWGLLAGVLVTLACLGSMDWATIAGCRPAGSYACTTLAEGYPLRWLTTVHNAPLISKSALLKDCVQWALASTTVLYLIWAALTSPRNQPD